MAKPATQRKFESVLDMPASAVERPKPLPRGTYIAVVQGQPRFDKNPNTGTQFAEFTLKLLQALEDVDKDELEAQGGLKERTTRVLFYLTDDSVYRLKEFLEHCGVDMDSDATMSQLVAETPGCQVGITIIHKPSKDGDAIYANVKNTFRPE